MLGLGACADAQEAAPSDSSATAGEPVHAVVPQPPHTKADAPSTDADVSEAPAIEDPHHGLVQSGDNLSKIFQRAGMDAKLTYAVTQALLQVMDPAHIREGQRYHFEFDNEELFQFRFERSPLEQALVERGADGQWMAKAVDVPSEVEEAGLGGSIETSLWDALTSRGEHPSLIALLVDVFAYDIDFFSETRPGDTFKVVVEKQSVDGEFVGYRRIIAAEYAGHVGTHRVYWWQPDEKAEGRYVDDEGRGVARTLLKTPLKYAVVSSGFNPKRMHPVLHRVKGHHGVDYAAPTGTPIWAAADGVISFRGPKGGAGNMVVLSHQGGLVTLYMHLSKFAEGQRVGTKVRAKDVIGYVGQTGLATGPHLHFGVRMGGRYVDPQKVKQRRGPGVPGTLKTRFRRQRDERLELLRAVAVK